MSEIFFLKLLHKSTIILMKNNAIKNQVTPETVHEIGVSICPNRVPIKGFTIISDAEKSPQFSNL